MNRVAGLRTRGVVSRANAPALLEVRVMKTKLDKKLSLNRETVTDLTDSQLDQAAGGGTTIGTISRPNTCICPPSDPDVSCSNWMCC